SRQWLWLLPLPASRQRTSIARRRRAALRQTLLLGLAGLVDQGVRRQPVEELGQRLQLVPRKTVAEELANPAHVRRCGIAELLVALVGEDGIRHARVVLVCSAVDVAGALEAVEQAR